MEAINQKVDVYSKFYLFWKFFKKLINSKNNIKI